MSDGEAPQGQDATCLTLADELQLVSGDIDRLSRRVDRMVARANERQAAHSVASESAAALKQDCAKGTARLAEAIANSPDGSTLRVTGKQADRVVDIDLLPAAAELIANGKPETRALEVWVSNKYHVLVRPPNGKRVFVTAGSQTFHVGDLAAVMGDGDWTRIYPDAARSIGSPAYAILRSALHGALALLQNAPRVDSSEYPGKLVSVAHLHQVVDGIAKTLATVTLLEQAANGSTDAARIVKDGEPAVGSGV